VHEGARDHQPALEAARQRLRLGGRVRAQVEAVEQLVHALAHASRPRPEIGGHHVQVLLDAEIAVERVVLRAHAELALERCDVVADVPPVHADDARIHAQKAVQHAQRGRLAGAVGAEEAEHLSGVTRDIDAVHDAAAAEMLDESCCFEQRRVVSHPCASMLPYDHFSSGRHA
jgi:hypothetical protein